MGKKRRDYNQYKVPYWQNNFRKKVSLPKGAHIVKKARGNCKAIRDTPIETVCPYCPKFGGSCHIRYLIYMVKRDYYARAVWDVAVLCADTKWRFK